MSARDVTFAVYALIGVALVALQAATWRRGSLTLGQLTSQPHAQAISATRVPAWVGLAGVAPIRPWQRHLPSLTPDKRVGNRVIGGCAEGAVSR